MIAAIMQPYFFPYIGYFQLMNAVDCFVFYDDVQYMKGGWVNRNRIRVDNEGKWLTFPVERASLSLPICQRRYILGKEIVNARESIRAAYRFAPAFSEVAPVLFRLLEYPDANVAAFNVNLLTELAHRLEIRCRFVTSSKIEKSVGLKGEERVIDLCQQIGADRYINPIGGIDLYDSARFQEAGIQLAFLRTTVEPQPLSSGSAQLSIIDTLFQKGFAGATSLLKAYELPEGG